MKSKILSILFSLLLTFISCRQEIVPPDSSLENINEPQLTRTNSSYTFSINASRITETVIDNTFLNTFKSKQAAHHPRELFVGNGKRNVQRLGNLFLAGGKVRRQEPQRARDNESADDCDD